jgi:hypothetical protein
VGVVSFPKVIRYKPLPLKKILHMGFTLEVVGVGKKEITCRRKIKYANNMHLKTKIDDLDGKISKI